MGEGGGSFRALLASHGDALQNARKYAVPAAPAKSPQNPWMDLSPALRGVILKFCFHKQASHVDARQNARKYAMPAPTKSPRTPWMDPSPAFDEGGRGGSFESFASTSRPPIWMHAKMHVNMQCPPPPRKVPGIPAWIKVLLLRGERGLRGGSFRALLPQAGLPCGCSPQCV